MIDIRYAKISDKEFWFSLDGHLPEDEYENITRLRRGYILLQDGQPEGLLRYNLFWDSIPFCTLLYISEACRGRGYGKRLMAHWEREMKARGSGILLTSTRADETSQHFYRRLGYKDCGCLIMDTPGYAQPTEIFLAKAL